MGKLIIKFFRDIFIPAYMGKTEQDIYDWFANLRDKLADVYLEYNITAAEYAKFSAAVDLLDLLLNWRLNWKNLGKTLTDHILVILGQTGSITVNPVLATLFGPNPETGAVSTISGLIPLIHEDWLVKKFRPSPLFTLAVQKFFGFIRTPNPDIDWKKRQPNVRLTPTKAGIFMRWNRRRAHGLLLEVNRNDGKGWVKINLYLTYWLDETPQPKIPTEWKYRGTYIRSGKVVGITSLEVSVIVQGD
jgi:hypothetical protein